MASCHIEGPAKPFKFSSGKDIWASVRIWEPVVSPNQENTDLLVDALTMEKDRLFKDITEAYKVAEKIGFISPNPFPSMWIVIYFSDGTGPRFFKFLVKSISKVHVSGNKITVGSAYHEGEVKKPVILVQDFLGRGIIINSFADLILNPEDQSVTEGGSVRLFEGRKPYTMHGLQIAYYAFMAKYVNILNNAEVVEFSKTIRMFMVFEVLTIAGMVSYYDYGRTYKNCFMAKEDATKFAKSFQDVEYITDEDVFRVQKKKFQIYDPEDPKFLLRVSTARQISYMLC